MSESIIELFEGLPSENLTTKVLKVLDFMIPGEWENPATFNDMIRKVTGVEEYKEIQKIRDRCLALYKDEDNGYQSAVWIYQTLDSADKVVATAALADKIGDTLSFIPFLDKLTPKADKVQTIDFCLKLVGELIAFSKINGITFNPAEFAAKVAENYQNEALIRMATLVAVDGLIPLGPNFLNKIEEIIDDTDEGSVANNAAFGALEEMIPSEDKKGFIKNTFTSVKGWMDNLVADTGLTIDSLLNRFGGIIDVADDKLDYLGAFLDASTNYYYHTGIQTVTRKVIEKAYQDLN